MIRHFFKDRRNGVFLDVGAATWKDDSTTYFLEADLGWTGVAIDARQELGADYAANRHNTKFFAYFVSDKSDAKEKLYKAGNISSGNKDHLKLFPAMNGYTAPEVEVATITLNDLLTRENIDHIDFMSMDIETFEPQALAGFDIEKYAPELVCIEAAPQTRDRIMEYFTKHGYTRIVAYDAHDWVNWYFEKKKPG